MSKQQSGRESLLMIRNQIVIRKEGRRGQSALILQEIASQEFVQWPIINGCGASWSQRTGHTNIIHIVKYKYHTYVKYKYKYKYHTYHPFTCEDQIVLL